MPQRIFCKMAVGMMIAALPLSSVVAADEVDLSGRVQSVEDHRPIEGARVEIRELHKSATTGRDGQYRFRDVAPGSYTLVVTPRSGASTERPLTLRQGDRDTTQDIDLAAAASTAVTLAEMQVTARTTQAIAARAMQQDAPNLILVQPATEIEKLPDINAGEAVRRLPGISLETDTGEGRFVNIRGIDADLNCGRRIKFEPLCRLWL